MLLQVAIIGLNKIGTSIGLGLSKHPDVLTCVGFDNEPGTGRLAVKRGAITKSFPGLHQCIKTTKVIILACPLDEVQKNLKIIADYAQEGTVVIDTSPAKQAVADWAQEILPEKVYFTGWTLALNPKHLHNPEVGMSAARADLFENSYIGINDPPGTPEEALSLSCNLVSLLEAKPLFVDAYEADVLIAMGQELPRISALALLLATSESPGWIEARKLSGEDYAKATLPILSLGEREEIGLSMYLNRDNLSRMIDDLIRALQTIQADLAAEDHKALKGSLEEALYQRILWLEQREKMAWAEPDRPEMREVKRPPILGEWLNSRLKKNNGRQDED